jgi:hypothetical protein
MHYAWNHSGEFFNVALRLSVPRTCAFTISEGLTLAPPIGPTMFGPMHRVGQFSSVATKRFQFSTKDHDGVIADVLGMIAKSIGRTPPA